MKQNSHGASWRRDVNGLVSYTVCVLSRLSKVDTCMLSARGSSEEIIRRTSLAVLFWAGELGLGVGVVCLGGQGSSFTGREKREEFGNSPS